MNGVNRHSKRLIKVLLICCLCGLAGGNKSGAELKDRDKIVIAYSSSLFVGVDKKDVKTALDMWITELAKIAEFKEPVMAIICDELEKIVESVRTSAVDYVALTTIDYLKIKNQVEIEPVLIATNRGKVGEEYALIIPKGASWTELKQLRGKRLLVEKSSGACSNALLWLDTQLLRQHLPPSQAFFQSVQLAEKASQALLPVFFRQADACLMPRWSYDTMVELNPQVKEQTAILALSPRLVRGGLFMVKGLAPDRRRMVNTTMQAWQTPRAKQLMTLFHAEEVVVYQAAYLQTMVNLYEEYLKLVKKQ